jgi:hypothetical protein
MVRALFFLIFWIRRRAWSGSKWIPYVFLTAKVSVIGHTRKCIWEWWAVLIYFLSGNYLKVTQIHFYSISWTDCSIKQNWRECLTKYHSKFTYPRGTNSHLNKNRDMPQHGKFIQAKEKQWNQSVENFTSMPLWNLPNLLILWLICSNSGCTHQSFPWFCSVGRFSREITHITRA